uniref:ORF43 n=1 Tax=Human herpesvirus 3 TaxID=10335 RepID=U5NTF4_HHV3|nr:ORF43 [Human alphaherpesvirus 3]
MEAHLANETKHALWHNDHTKGLLHVVIPNAGLIAAGIDPALLILKKPGQRFKVEVQTRYHATGQCEPWCQVFAAYIPDNALTNLLIPKTEPFVSHVFSATHNSGGLILSLPVYLSPGLFFDAFNVVAIRINTGNRKHRDICIMYAELIPNGTRYFADGQRVLLLCKQLIAYIRCTPRLASSIKIYAEHMVAAMGESHTSNGDNIGPVSSIIDLDRQLTSGGIDDSPAETRIQENNRDVLELIKRAVNIVNSRHPVRPSSSRVASGLLQSAKGHGAQTSNTDPINNGSFDGVLEPPGQGRFTGKKNNSSASIPPLQDVLLFTPASTEPQSLMEWFDICYAQLVSGDTPADFWKRRPLSIVPRHYAESPSPLIVVSYNGSSAWGGRITGSPILYHSAQAIIDAACINARVDNPQSLHVTARQELVARLPFLANILNNQTPLPAFKPGAEMFLNQVFKQACVTSLTQGLITELQTNPTLQQLMEYDIADSSQTVIDEIVARTPDLIQTIVSVLTEMSMDAFYNSSLMYAVLAYLSSVYTRPQGGGYIPYLHASFPCWLGNRSIYLFDYYNSGGEILKLSKVPVPVALEKVGIGNSTQLRGKFIRSADIVDIGICSKYLPGQCYAYICLGFNQQLQSILVLPGGFAACFCITDTLQAALPASLIGPILDRFCFSIPNPHK